MTPRLPWLPARRPAGARPDPARRVPHPRLRPDMDPRRGRRPGPARCCGRGPHRTHRRPPGGPVTQPTRPFHLGDILTVTTGTFMASRGVEALYDLLGFMTDDTLFTHQLPRAADECAPRLLAQHPDLADVRTPEAWEVGDVAPEAVEGWLAEQVARFGETRDVAPLAAEDHTHIDPITEMEQYKPGGLILPVVLPDEESR